MNSRERFLKVMNYEKADYVSDMEFGYWDETLERWHSEGLPSELNDNLSAEKYFGFEETIGVPVEVGLYPGFEREVLEDFPDKQIIRNEEGIICEVLKGKSSIPKYIKYPIETKEDWKKFKEERFNPDNSERVPNLQTWENLKEEWKKREVPLAIHCGSLYGNLRNLMGVEGISIAIATEPEWVDEMMEHLTRLTLKVIETAAGEVDIDCASWWEDMCFNKGPLISPKMFNKFMAPRYRRITSFLYEHGIKINILDCDGKIDELVPLWLDAGINCMFPVEAAHSDPVELRKKFGKKLLLKGGVNKLALIRGKKEIDKELEKLKPLVEGGGYIPHVDHRVPPDVSLENYRYYIRKKRELINKGGKQK